VRLLLGVSEPFLLPPNLEKDEANGRGGGRGKGRGKAVIWYCEQYSGKKVVITLTMTSIFVFCDRILIAIEESQL
jgi:hypothetical protein